MLDAPLPNSFDSQGMSQAARFGPISSSAPLRFSIESPSSSLPKTQLGYTALRDVRPAFGDTTNLDGVLHGLGSSPRDNEPLTFTKRPLHSERLARSRPMMMSSSLDVRSTRFATDTSSEEGSEDGVGEDLLPSSLHDLLPQEKLRRSSRHATDEESTKVPQPRRMLSSGYSSQENRIGSLSPHSASPSRYSSMWAARPSNNKADSDANFLGHVGSPLRPSNLRTSSSSGSPHANGGTVGGMSMLTSELQRTNLGEGQSQQATSSFGMIRNTTNPPSLARSGLGDRGFSSNSLGRDKIDEEAMFSMEEDGDDTTPTAPLNGINPLDNPEDTHQARKGSNPLFGLGKSAATLGPIERPTK